MRTNIEIDDALLNAVMTATGLASKEATVEQALRILIERRRLTNAVANLSGIGWVGNLDEIRRDQSDDEG